MTAFATALATLHADANMGTAADYRRPPYAWHPVRVILSQPTDALGAVRAGTVVAELRAEALAALGYQAERRDQLRIGAAVYTVEEAERDALALSWRLTLSEPATP